MSTNREIREMKRLAMAEKRIARERAKEFKKTLRQQGLAEYKGEIIPIHEARKLWGQEGAKHGWKGASHGWKGAKNGRMGAKHGHKGAKYGHKGAEHGHKGAEHGLEGAEHEFKAGWKGSENIGQGVNHDWIPERNTEQLLGHCIGVDYDDGEDESGGERPNSSDEEQGSTVHEKYTTPVVPEGEREQGLRMGKRKKSQEFSVLYERKVKRSRSSILQENKDVENQISETTKNLLINPETGQVYEKHTCNVCLKVYGSIKGLNKHTVTHSVKLEHEPGVKLPDGIKVIKQDPENVSYLRSRNENKPPRKRALRECTSARNSPSQDKEVKHNCDLCNKSFSRPKYLKMHKEASHLDEQIVPVTCPKCDELFLSKVKLDSHLYEEHFKTVPDKDMFGPSCGRCMHIFDTKLELVLHYVECLEKVPEPRTYPCQCGKEFSALRFLSNHSLTCKAKGDKENRTVQSVSSSPTTEWKCDADNCGKLFSEFIKFKNHLYTHSEIPFFCPSEGCKAGFTIKDGFKEHNRIEHNSNLKLYSCTSCTEEFSSQEDLMIHAEREHEDDDSFDVVGEHGDVNSDFPCKLDKSGSELVTPTESSETLTSCDLCGESFFREKQLLKHIMNHDIDILSCPVQKCTRHFCKKETFDEHLAMHTTEKDFLCTECKYQCYNFRQLEYHLNSGHKLKPKPEEYTSETNLTCPYPGCMKSFVQEKWLYKHRKTLHSQWDSEDETLEPTVQILKTTRGRKSRDIKKPMYTKIKTEMKSIEAESSSAEIKKNGCLRTVETNIQDEGEKEIEFFSSRDQVGADKSSKNGENMEKDGLQMISIVDYSNQGLEQSSSEQADYVIVNAVFENGEGAGCSSYDDIAAPEPEEPEIPNSGTRDIKHEKTSLLRDIKQENSSPAPCLSTYPLQPNMKIKEEVTDPMYHLLISRNVCPEIGDFSSMFGITAQSMLDLKIPRKLKTDEDNIGKGLAIDLLHLTSIGNLPNTILARFVSELLPERCRPHESALTEDGSRKLANRILKLRIQASRFRAKYQQFPKYLDKFLVEKFYPFSEP